MLKREYDRLQSEYGSAQLKSIHFGGMSRNPRACFVFMNPTKGNIASFGEWSGERVPWVGTKNIWKLFYRTGIISAELFKQIQAMKPKDWTEEFAKKAYEEIERSQVFITNLGKCTQEDARPLPNKVFMQYLDLLFEEISLVDPGVVVTFGNQVSSIVLGRKVEVSKCRKESFWLEIGGKNYDIYPVYYPIGNGMRNIDKAADDLKYVLDRYF